MKPIKVIVTTGVQTASKLGLSFILIKIIAVSAGPAGLVRFNQFLAFISVLAVFSTAPVSMGLVRYSAESVDDDSAKSALFSTAFQAALATSLVCAVLLELFAAEFSQAIFGSYEYIWIVRLIGISNLFSVLNALLVSILTGQREFNRLMWTNILANVFAVGLGIWMMVEEGLYGAMLGYAGGQCLAFGSTIFLAKGARGIHRSYFAHAINWRVARNLSSYTLICLITAASVPVVELVLRNRIAERYSWTEAGYWQGLAKISDAYLLIVNSFLGIYFLPALSSSSTRKVLRETVFVTTKIVLPLALLLAITIYLFRDDVLLLLFSPAFLVSRDHISTQLCGDILRVASGIVGYIIIARGSRWIYLVTELVSLLSYLILGCLLIDRCGWVGAIYAFVLYQVVYLAITPFAARKIMWE